MGAQQVDRFKTASTLLLSFKDIIIGGWYSTAHHDTVWNSFSAQGSSRDEYILTRFDRHTGSKYARAAARAAATRVGVRLESEATL